MKAMDKRIDRMERRLGVGWRPRPSFVIEYINPVDKSVVSTLYIGSDGTQRWDPPKDRQEA